MECYELSSKETVKKLNSEKYNRKSPVFIEAKNISTELGDIKNLFHFTNLAKTDWNEAVRLFSSKNFINVLGGSEKPDVDSIDGLSPSIAIDQKTTSKNPRSTVGTVTEIYDHFRLLFARIGIPHCPNCGKQIERQSVDQMVDIIMNLPEGTKFIDNYCGETTMTFVGDTWSNVALEGFTIQNPDDLKMAMLFDMPFQYDTDAKRIIADLREDGCRLQMNFNTGDNNATDSGAVANFVLYGITISIMQYQSVVALYDVSNALVQVYYGMTIKPNTDYNLEVEIVAGPGCPVCVTPIDYIDEAVSLAAKVLSEHLNLFVNLSEASVILVVRILVA